MRLSQFLFICVAPWMFMCCHISLRVIVLLTRRVVPHLVEFCGLVRFGLLQWILKKDGVHLGWIKVIAPLTPGWCVGDSWVDASTMKALQLAVNAACARSSDHSIAPYYRKWNYRERRKILNKSSLAPSVNRMADARISSDSSIR